jgi:hypothetical protein
MKDENFDTRLNRKLSHSKTIISLQHECGIRGNKESAGLQILRCIEIFYGQKKAPDFSDAFSQLFGKIILPVSFR